MTLGDLFGDLLNTHILVLLFDLSFLVIISIWGFLTLRYFQYSTKVTISKIIICVVPSIIYFLLLSQLYDYLDYKFLFYLRSKQVPFWN